MQSELKKLQVSSEESLNAIKNLEIQKESVAKGRTSIIQRQNSTRLQKLEIDLLEKEKLILDQANSTLLVCLK